MTTDLNFWKWTNLKDKIVVRSWHTERLPEGLRATVTFLKKSNMGLCVSVEVYKNSTSTDKYFNVFNDGSLARAWIEEVSAFIESKKEA